MANFNLADYETVDSRLNRFYEKHPEGRIITHLVETRTNDLGQIIQYVFKAEAYRNFADAVAAATGYAEEQVGSNPVNRTSPLENCETSAIGRCLANLGFSPKGSRPTQTEMTKAERTKPETKQLTPQQEVTAKAKHFKLAPSDIIAFCLFADGAKTVDEIDWASLNNMTKEEWITRLAEYVKPSEGA